MSSEVVLYELNEVPWEIVDLYVTHRPESNVARLLGQSRSMTTLFTEDVHLQPWRTWPTFHSGLDVSEHHSMELGQDPATIMGTPIWSEVLNSGLKVGLFGPLQSWPPVVSDSGGFHIPDTFAQDARTVPSSISAFQEFNLRMTREQGGSSTARLDKSQLFRAGRDLMRNGLRARSVARIGRHMARELKDGRYKGARPILQVIPSFDLYWRLHKKVEPSLSIFFTNHVAAMMHRYWGDAVPTYGDLYKYAPDPIFKTFLFEALDIFDSHLSDILAWQYRDPGTRYIVVASSMGQGPIEKKDAKAWPIVKSADRFLATFGMVDAKPALAMYPRFSVTADGAQRAFEVAETLRSVSVGGEPLFSEVDIEGSSISCAIDYEAGRDSRVVSATIFQYRRSDIVEVPCEEAGLDFEDRIGGGNTAYHVPEGIFILKGEGIRPDDSRRQFDVRSAKPLLMSLLGLHVELRQTNEPLKDLTELHNHDRIS